MNVSLGQLLTAKDPCIVGTDNHPTLTIGKKYEVIYIGEYNNYVTIINDRKETHNFGKRNLYRYFQDNSKVYIPNPKFDPLI